MNPKLKQAHDKLFEAKVLMVQLRSDLTGFNVDLIDHHIEKVDQIMEDLPRIKFPVPNSE